MRALALCLALSLPGIGLAQDSKPADPEAEGRRLLASFKTHDPDLCQTYRFGRYFLGRTHAGTLTFEVQRAKEGEGYSLKTVLVLSTNIVKKKAKTHLEGRTEMDVKFGVLSSSSKLVRRDEQGVVVEEVRRESRRSDTEWIDTRESLGEEVVQRGPLTGHNHSSYGGMIILARKIANRHGLVVRLQATHPMRDDTIRLDPLTIKVLPKEELVFRGESLQVTRVRFEQPNDDPTNVFVDAKGRVLVIKTDDNASQFLAGTADEVSKDLASTDPLDAAKAVVARYLEITSAKVGDLDEAFGLVDWSEFFKLSAARSPSIEKMGQARFAAKHQKAIRDEAPGLTPEHAKALGMLCKARRAGEDVVVSLPGGSGTNFLVRRKDGAWKIVDLPF